MKYDDDKVCCHNDMESGKCTATATNKDYLLCNFHAKFYEWQASHATKSLALAPPEPRKSTDNSVLQSLNSALALSPEAKEATDTMKRYIVIGSAVAISYAVAQHLISFLAEYSSKIMSGGIRFDKAGGSPRPMLTEAEKLEIKTRKNWFDPLPYTPEQLASVDPDTAAKALADWHTKNVLTIKYAFQKKVKADQMARDDAAKSPEA